MHKIARFTIRPEGDKGSIILGAMFNLPSAQQALKAGIIYEIREIMGELVVVEIGESELQLDANRTSVSWNHSVNDILECGGKYIFLTKDEIDNL